MTDWKLRIIYNYNICPVSKSLLPAEITGKKKQKIMPLLKQTNKVNHEQNTKIILKTKKKPYCTDVETIWKFYREDAKDAILYGP